MFTKHLLPSIANLYYCLKILHFSLKNAVLFLLYFSKKVMTLVLSCIIVRRNKMSIRVVKSRRLNLRETQVSLGCKESL